MVIQYQVSIKYREIRMGLSCIADQNAVGEGREIENKQYWGLKRRNVLV